jgi:SM-20-related protein
MEDQLDYISQEIYSNSYVVVDNFVDESYRKALLKEQTELLNKGQFKKAAVGKGDQKQVLNRRCFLGLKSFEGHFARYPVGSFYKRHLDQFHAVPHRIVTVILYLNDSWTEADGGQLRMYFPQEDGSERLEDVLPVGGRLVVFLSEEIPHEVMPTQKERISITGWLRNID